MSYSLPDKLRFAADVIDSRIGVNDPHADIYKPLATWFRCYASSAEQGVNPNPSVPLVLADNIIKRFGAV